MTDEQKKAHDELIKEIEGKVAGLVADATKEGVTKADLEKKVADINKQIADNLTSKEVDELKKRLDEMSKKNEQLEKASREQGAELTKMKNGNTPQTKASFKESLKAAILQYKDKCLEEITDVNGTRLSMRKWFEGGNQKSPEFQIKDGSDLITKVAVDMTEANVIQNYAQYLRMTELQPGLVGIPLTIYPSVLDYFPQRNIARSSMAMLVAYSYEDGVGTKTEGSSSSKSSLLFKTVSFPAFAIYTYFSLSDETLDDLDEALSEISRVAPSKVKEAIDGKVYSDAGNDSTDIMGMFVNGSKCTDFTASTYAGSVKNANMIDLIEAMIAACEANNYQPDTVGLNPVDVRLKFNSLKNQLDDSIKDNRLVFVNGKLTSICGLRVVVSAKITADTCFVGKIMDNALLGIRKAMSLEIGLNSTDFVEGQKTVRVGMRVAFGVGDKAGIIYSSQMASDLNTITAGA